MESLPNEILLYIFEYAPSDIYYISLTSKLFASIIARNKDICLVNSVIANPAPLVKYMVHKYKSKLHRYLSQWIVQSIGSTFFINSDCGLRLRIWFPRAIYYSSTTNPIYTKITNMDANYSFMNDTNHVCGYDRRTCHEDIDDIIHKFNKYKIILNALKKDI